MAAAHALALVVHRAPAAQEAAATHGVAVARCIPWPRPTDCGRSGLRPYQGPQPHAATPMGRAAAIRRAAPAPSAAAPLRPFDAPLVRRLRAAPPPLARARAEVCPHKQTCERDIGLTIGHNRGAHLYIPTAQGPGPQTLAAPGRAARRRTRWRASAARCRRASRLGPRTRRAPRGWAWASRRPRWWSSSPSRGARRHDGLTGSAADQRHGAVFNRDGLSRYTCDICGPVRTWHGTVIIGISSMSPRFVPSLRFSCSFA